MDASSSSPFTAANSSMAANSTDASVSSSYWKYGVFLSFRGEDTRNNFTSHLYKALDQKGIDTFKDDMKLIRGEELSPAFVKAIQRSRCSIIVLSENYASSKWCLEELVKILECKRTKNQRVVPIFYNVDPSHVRNQTGSFGEALSKHEKDSKIKEEKVRKWREALTQVANLSGWNSLNKSEAQLIEEIAVNISKDSNCVPSKDTQILVGVDSKIRELESLLCLESTDVRMIGIWGMGGIGKTTLARAIYEKNLDKFEGYCFLANVGDLARKGEDYLKKELLSRILKDKNIDVAIPSLKARLHSKKVLIVIDNVNNRSILKWLVGQSSWFGPQSRIIITTRDKHFFTMCGVNAMYEVKKLQNDDAIELFNHYAFRNSPPTEDVMELIHRVIAYAQGLPLALEVLGSSLCNKSKVEWVCLLNKLKKIPDMEIQRVLEISFDELDEDQKGIFLDIVFIFRGEDKDLTTEILNSCGFSPISGIKTLLDKSLLSIRDHKLYMHDLLVEMGKDIVRRTSPKEPGKRSRLCMQQDIRHVLQKNTGTEEVEVIALDLCGLKEIRLTTAAFAKMTKLRVLSITECSSTAAFAKMTKFRVVSRTKLRVLSITECSSGQMQCEVYISDDFKFHYDELRYLLWDQYPLNLLPSDFESENLVCLRMPNSHLTQLWEGNKVFENLKYMILDYSKYLTETPDFSMAANLKILSFKGCTELCKIHPSLGDLDKLTGLSLENCQNLKHFPGLGQLVSLEILVLSGCSKLEKFPDISQHMPCLSNLYLGGTAITQLPSSIDFATELVLLDLKNCTRLKSLPNSICKLARLETLFLSGCSKLEKFPDISQHMPCLSNLYLDETAITELPSSIDFATELVLLDLKNCTRLQSLPNSICKLARLETLSLSGCPKLEKLPDISQHMPCLSNLYLCGTAITQLPAIDFASKLVLLDLKNCTRLQSLPNSICKLACLKTLSLSGCSKLEKFPNISQHMPCLSELYLDRTAITELPSSIDFATKLVVLNLKYCTRLQSLPNSICKLALLESLYLSGCSRLGECQVGAGNLDAFPRNLNRLSNLRNLELQNCKSLRALPVLPPRLRLMNASDCPSLKNISPQSVFNLLGRFLFPNCFQMRKLSSQMEPHLRNMATHVGKDRWRSTYAKEYPYVNVPLSIVLPGSTIPDWFMHYGKGHEVKIDVNPDWYDRNFLGFALSAVIAPKDGFITSGWVTYCDLDSYDLNSKLESSRICSFIDLYTFQLRYSIILSDHLWLAYIPSFFSFNDKKWNSIKFSFSTSAESCIVKHCAVCPLYIKGGSDRDCSNGKSCSMEGLGLQTGNDNNIDHKGNPSGSVLDDLGRSGLKDTKIRRCREEQLVLRKRYNRLNNLRDSQAWFQFQERHQMQLNPPTSDIGPHFWIFITIFMLLFLACIFYLAP